MDSLCLLVVLLFCMHAWSPQTCSALLCISSHTVKRLTAAAAHVCARELDFYEGSACMCSFSFAKQRNVGNFKLVALEGSLGTF